MLGENFLEIIKKFIYFEVGYFKKMYQDGEEVYLFLIFENKSRINFYKK